MKMPQEVNTLLLAPCEVNCEVCSMHLSSKKSCCGCLVDGEYKRPVCSTCAKKRCAISKGVIWCHQCGLFPCARLRPFARRYLQSYHIDIVQNGKDARTRGVYAFMQGQKEKFTCECGGIISQHDGICSECARQRA